MTAADSSSSLRTTALFPLHQELGARMVPFAGYSMPVQYPQGLMAEHLHTRKAAGLFDVSHMGQLLVRGPQAAAALESLMPVDVMGLGLHKQRYGLLLNDQGGILDDLMFVNRGDDLLLIVNGACKQADIAYIRQHIGQQCEMVPLLSQSLLALQGPASARALERLLPGVQALIFMTGNHFEWQGHALYITRSGYTGEDGFEISLPDEAAEAFARALLQQPEVAPIGLGARNSLRLEAGLCLYGHDIDATTTPVEGALGWAIPKIRRSGGAREGGFPGSSIILEQLQNTASLSRLRVGLIAQQRIPVREPAVLENMDGQHMGHITSGLLSPSLNQPIAMAYVPPDYAVIGTEIFAMVRGQPVSMKVAIMPFIPPHYFRG